MNTKEFAAFKNPVMKVYRAVANCDDHAAGVYHPDRTIIRQLAGAMHPAVLLKYYRLKTAIRIATS